MTDRFLNQWKCQLCDWNSDRSSPYPADELAKQGRIMISCTRPTDAVQAMEKCRGMMLLVGMTGKLEGET